MTLTPTEERAIQEKAALTASKKRHWGDMKRLKDLHAQVHPDPDIVQSARARWPELLDRAVWVPYFIFEPSAYLQHIHFLTVCKDEPKGDFVPRIRLVVIEYNEPVGVEKDAPAYRKRPALGIAALVPIQAATIGTLADTFRMFFTYFQTTKQKKAIYMEEVERKRAHGESLEGRLAKSNEWEE